MVRDMGKLFQFPAKHPYVSAVFVFIFIFLPQWLSGLWSLFSNEPLAVALKRWLDSMSIPSFSPYWVTASVGTVMFLWLIYELRQNRKPTTDQVPHIESESSSSEPQLIPLPDACKYAYEETQETLSAAMAEKFSDGDPDNILSWYACAITGGGDATLYGTKPPSKKAIEISKEVFPSHHFYDGVTRLALHGGNDIGYHDLAVMRDELETAIKCIKSWDENESVHLTDVDTRISLIELRDEAIKKGWDFGDKSLHGLDFALALSQAGLDSEIKFFGRENKHMFEGLNRQELLHQIDADHWQKFKVEPIGFLQSDDNFKVHTYIPGMADKGYSDIHVIKKEAMAWLNTTAKASKSGDPKKWQ